MSYTINVTGRMYIGDLCYALSDEIYDGVWGASDYKDGAYKTEKGEFAMVGTAYGDGTYEGSDGFYYPVDAGIIGICDANLVEKEISDFGRLVDAVGEANISYEDGTIYITYTTPDGGTKMVDIVTDEYDDNTTDDIAEAMIEDYLVDIEDDDFGPTEEDLDED